MDEFVDYLYEAFSGRKLEGIDAVASCLIFTERKSRLAARFMTPDSFFPIGLKIYRDIEELYIEGLAESKNIQLFTEEVIPEQTLKRIQSLSFFYEEFYKTVREMDFSTRSYRYRRS